MIWPMARDLPQAKTTVPRLPDLIPIALLTRYFGREVVEAAVDAAQVREQRSRLLPAPMVVYHCLAMVVFSPAGSCEVWDRLLSGLQWTGALDHRPETPSREAISRARQRLGWEVMAALLARVAGPVAASGDDGAFVAGLRPVVLDAATLNVPYTAKNAAEYGTEPKMLVMAAGESGSGAVIGAVTGTPSDGTTGLAGELLHHLGTGTLAVFDQDFQPQGLPALVRSTGAHMLCHAATPAWLPTLRTLDDGSYLSQPYGSADDEVVRVIECRAPCTSVLVTDLLDPSRLSCAQARATARTRWRLTGCLDALRLSCGDGSGLVFRSKSPELLRQELYSALCVYQAIRGLRNDAALS
jgi:hypothetical protein